MTDVVALPVQAKPTEELPKPIMRPCDYGLWNAVRAMETQVGTVEAYNRLCQWAAQLHAKIEAGDAKAPHPMWLTDPKFIYPAG